MSFARNLTTLAMTITLFVPALVAQADPLPGRDLLKFSQKPMDGTPIVTPDGTTGRFFGHDELSTAWGSPDASGATIYQGRFMADDFADQLNSPVVHVKWWGSYLENQIFQPVDKFLISFESDVPADPLAGFSRPGEPLLNQIVRRGPLSPGSGTFTEKPISPGGPPLDEKLYEYNAELHLDKPFPEDNDTVYWLKIVALVDVADIGVPMTQWGWHNRDYTIPNPLASPLVVPGERIVGDLPGGEPIWHFQDNAVEGSVFVDTAGPNGAKMPVIDQADYQPTDYINGIDGPAGIAGTDFPGIGRFSKDLAFEIYTTVPEPTSIVMASLGLFAMIGWLRFQRV